MKVVASIFKVFFVKKLKTNWKKSLKEVKIFHCFFDCFFKQTFWPKKWNLEGRTSKTFQFSNFLRFLKSACIFKRSFVCERMELVCERMELDNLRGGGLLGEVEIRSACAAVQTFEGYMHTQFAMRRAQKIGKLESF